MCLISCSGSEQKEFLPDLPNQKIDFHESIGRYVHIFDESDRDQLAYFGRNIGDTIVFQIKSDSTFVFNHFYYDKMKKIENYQGKIEKDYNLTDFKIPFPKDASFDIQGFVKAKEGLYFYTRLRMEGFENYEYQLFYKKVK